MTLTIAGDTWYFECFLKLLSCSGVSRGLLGCPGVSWGVLGCHGVSWGVHVLHGAPARAGTLRVEQILHYAGAP